MPGRRLQGSRPSFFIAESMRPTGMAEIRRSYAPVVVSAASSALVIAASVAAAPSIREQGQLLAPLPATADLVYQGTVCGPNVKGGAN